MAALAFNLHPAQAEIHAHEARFKIVAAGRRFGKTVFSVIRCFEEALATENQYGVKYDSSSICTRDREGYRTASPNAREDFSDPPTT
jgi:hypothetical protein